MKKGFTLIELVIVVAVIGIMASIYSDSSSLFRSKNNLRAATAKSLNTINLARNLAILGRQEVCIEFTSSNSIKYCDGKTPTFDQHKQERAFFAKRKLDSLLNTNEFIEAKAGITTDNNMMQLSFNERGMRTSGSRYFLFTSQKDSALNFLIEVSISGSTRFCTVDDTTKTTCK